jgi:hypothetical protein
MKALLSLRVFTLIPYDKPIKGDSSVGNMGDEIGLRLTIYAHRNISIPTQTEPHKMPVRLKIWSDDDVNDCEVTSVSWELKEDALIPHIECQWVDELDKDPEWTFEEQLSYHSGEGKDEITKRLLSQSFEVDKEISKQVMYEKCFAEVMEEILSPIPTLEAVDRGRGLKEPAKLNTTQIEKILSFYDPLTKVGRLIKKLLVENRNHPTEGMANEQSAINKELSKKSVDGLRLILCTRHFKSQLWVLK